MSSPAATLRQRAPKKQISSPDINGSRDKDVDSPISKTQDAVKEAVKSEWDYKLALVVLTILAFLTRFYGITHPNQVVFDEVHFGKVGIYYMLAFCTQS